MLDLNNYSRPRSPNVHRKETMKRGRSEINYATHNNFELKSSIPKPIPFTRRSSSANHLIKTHYNHNCLSANILSAGHEKKSYSLSYRSPTRDNSSMKKHLLSRFPSEKQFQTPMRSSIPRMVNRPKSAGILRTPFHKNNQYANIKAKVNTNLTRPVSPKAGRPVSPSQVRPGSPTLVRPKSPKLVPPVMPNSMYPVTPKLNRPASPKGLVSPKVNRPVSPKVNHPETPKAVNTNTALKSSIYTMSKTSISTKSVEENDSPPTVEQKQLSDENTEKKQKQMMRIHNEMKELQSIAEQQVLELKIQPNILEKPKSPSCDKAILLAEDSSEFLTIFEKRMEKILESWLRFICDVISHKLLIGNSSLSRITLPDPFQDPRKEVYKYLVQMPTEGDNLQMKLQNLEEDLLKVKTAVMHKMTSLWKDFEDLKDEHWRLEKTQDHLHSELQEELEILSEENKTLDKKYITAVEKYNQEKAKYETQEKSKLLINRDVLEVKKKIKHLEGKCTEWQFNVKKFEAECKIIEASVRNTNLSLDKEAKQHREMFCRYNDAQDTINELNAEIIKRKEAYMSLEEVNKTLKQENNVMKASLEESLEKRNALTKDLAEKKKQLNDVQSGQYITYNGDRNTSAVQTTTNEVQAMMVEDLQKRDAQVEELKKKLTDLENKLHEKSDTEEELRRQVKNLQLDHSIENEIALKTQIKDLQYTIKDLTDEKSELEKIVAQKSLELDQRDLMIKQNSEILRARDELIPLIQSKQKNHKECTERLRAVVLNHEINYNSPDKDGFHRTENMIMDNMEALNKIFIHNPSVVERELSFHQEKMAEVYNLLEQKELEMMRMERRLRELQRIHDEKEKIEQEREERLSAIQKEFQEAKERRANRSRGFFSMFTSQDNSSG